MIQSTTAIRRIAIIGGGPTGIACAKYFVAEQAFSVIDIFEQRPRVGGVWNLSENHRSRNVDVPQTNPRYGTGDHTDKSLEFESPLYDYLETNIPKTLMAYSDLPFSDDLPLYPKHDDVLKYLETYADSVKERIHFSKQAIDLCPLNPCSEAESLLEQSWKLTTRDLRSGKCTTDNYDAVVIANGHYTVPHIPQISGIAEWHAKYPDTIIHSKAYRRPEDFSGKRVLVIGNSASGIDIAGQLSQHVRQPVYLASRSASQFAANGNSPIWRHDVAEIDAFLLDSDTRAVRTETGEVIKGLDIVIFATGYFYSYPFLKLPSATTLSSSKSSSSLASSSSSATIDQHDVAANESKPVRIRENDDGVTSSGQRTHHMYQHFLHNRYPTLAIPVLNLKIIPFPLAENQAAVLARLWSGRLDLPSHKEMQEWECTEEKRLAGAKRLRPAPRADVEDSVGALHGSDDYEGGFHTLNYPEDVRQLNTLYEWAASARHRPDLENQGVGKLGVSRNERDTWLRGKLADLKAAYIAHGDDRTTVKTVEMLGEKWRSAFREWSSTTDKNTKQDLFTQAAVAG